MPNRCNNTVSISGPKVEVLKIEKYIKSIETKRGEEYSFFNNFYPRPEELERYTSPVRAENGETEEEFKMRVERCKRDYGATDWYEWSIANWGTKRDVSNLCIDWVAPTFLSFSYNTAGGPAVPALRKLSELHPEVKISLSYDKPEMRSSGFIDFKAGVIINETHFDDPYYGTGKKCIECGCIYDIENETDWDESNPNVCRCCVEIKRNKKD